MEVQRRNSKQRQLIFDAVKSSHQHPTAEAVYQEVKQINPAISLGTVYRNLKLLCEDGKLVNLKEGFDCDHFDGDCSPHPHLVCSQCKRVFDLKMDFAPTLVNITGYEQDAEIRCIRITAFGICSSCKKLQNKDDASQN